MSLDLRVVAAIARNEARILRRDPFPLVVLVAMPLVLMAFLEPAFADVVRRAGGGANGAQHVVPGMAVTFGFLLSANVGFAFFREHGWLTWDRVRVAPVRDAELLLGKALVPLAMSLTQMAGLFVLGGLLFGLDPEGSPFAIAAVTLAFSACLVAFAILLVALCRSVMQLNALAQVTALVLAGVGGALTPIATMPPWVEAVAVATPTYWAMEGYGAAILTPASLGDVLDEVGVLALFVVALLAAIRARFRFDERKVSWA